MTDSELLTAHLSDKLSLCQKNDMIVSTRFLDLTERAEAVRFCSVQKAPSVFFGGYGDAERTVCVFLPDFLSPDIFPQYFKGNPGNIHIIN